MISKKTKTIDVKNLQERHGQNYEQRKEAKKAKRKKAPENIKNAPEMGGM